MKKIAFVVLLLFANSLCMAASLNDSLNRIESAWAEVYYSNNNNKPEVYLKLLQQAKDLSSQYPQAAEPLIWQAILIATNADHQDAVSALDAIYEARKLLNQAIATDPTALGGSAYVTLGTLYYMAPKWPLAFGDTEEAKKLLETALEINPDGIDSNYFYGDFLLSLDQPEQAARYFEKALNAPIRKEQTFADRQLQSEARIALKNAQQHKISKGRTIFHSLLSTVSLN